MVNVQPRGNPDPGACSSTWGPRGASLPLLPRIRLLAHSAHLCTARSRVEVSTRGLHQTCAYPWCTFPESLVELLPLLHGATPGLSAEFGLLAHSAHLCTVRRRVEQCTRGLHQTCAYPWCTFPENLAELRPLLPGVTPGLFEFSPETQGSREMCTQVGPGTTPGLWSPWKRIEEVVGKMCTHGTTPPSQGKVP